MTLSCEQFSQTFQRLDAKSDCPKLRDTRQWGAFGRNGFRKIIAVDAALPEQELTQICFCGSGLTEVSSTHTCRSLIDQNAALVARKAGIRCTSRNH